jgi:CPA1 family monovalent cation:H+ antiporter
MIFRRRNRSDADPAARATPSRTDPVRPTLPACPHVAELPDTEPEPGTAEGCAECIANGTNWVHLRKCMTCGYIGCCDTGRWRHATAHHRETNHPIMRSFEPGESWRWCFVDESLV